MKDDGPSPKGGGITHHSTLLRDEGKTSSEPKNDRVQPSRTCILGGQRSESSHQSTKLLHTKCAAKVTSPNQPDRTVHDEKRVIYLDYPSRNIANTYGYYSTHYMPQLFAHRSHIDAAYHSAYPPQIDRQVCAVNVQYLPRSWQAYAAQESPNNLKSPSSNVTSVGKELPWATTQSSSPHSHNMIEPHNRTYLNSNWNISHHQFAPHPCISHHYANQPITSRGRMPPSVPPSHGQPPYTAALIDLKGCDKVKKIKGAKKMGNSKSSREGTSSSERLCSYSSLPSSENHLSVDLSIDSDKESLGRASADCTKNRISTNELNEAFGYTGFLSMRKQSQPKSLSSPSAPETKSIIGAEKTIDKICRLRPMNNSFRLPSNLPPNSNVSSIKSLQRCNEKTLNDDDLSSLQQSPQLEGDNVLPVSSAAKTTEVRRHSPDPKSGISQKQNSVKTRNDFILELSSDNSLISSRRYNVQPCSSHAQPSCPVPCEMPHNLTVTVAKEKPLSSIPTSNEFDTSVEPLVSKTRKSSRRECSEKTSGLKSKPSIIASSARRMHASFPEKDSFYKFGTSKFQQQRNVDHSSTFMQNQLSSPLTAQDVLRVISPNASTVVHIYDRRVNMDSFNKNVALYSLLRAWVQDDPNRTVFECGGLDGWGDKAIPLSARRDEGSNNCVSSPCDISQNDQIRCNVAHKLKRSHIEIVNSNALLQSHIDRGKKARSHLRKADRLRMNLARTQLLKMGITLPP